MSKRCHLQGVSKVVKSYRKILIMAQAIRFADRMAIFYAKKEDEEPPLPEFLTCNASRDE